METNSNGHLPLPYNAVIQPGSVAAERLRAGETPLGSPTLSAEGERVRQIYRDVRAQVANAIPVVLQPNDPSKPRWKDVWRGEQQERSRTRK